jgi:hypothetical protein
MRIAIRRSFVGSKPSADSSPPGHRWPHCVAGFPDNAGIFAWSSSRSAWTRNASGVPTAPVPADGAEGVELSWPNRFPELDTQAGTSAPVGAVVSAVIGTAALTQRQNRRNCGSFEPALTCPQAGHRGTPGSPRKRALMCRMFEITGDDIARLNDEQLRSVVARLCEAELRGRGYSTSYVTWGGN